MNPRVPRQEIAHFLCLVSRQVVDDEMDFSRSRLARYDIGKKGNKLSACVPWCGFSDHFSRPSVQRGIQRESSVPVVLKAVTFSASRRQWEHGVAAVECLNRRFLINAKNRRMLGRIYVEPDDVGRLSLEIRVVRHHVMFESMGLKAGPLPNSGNHHVTDTKVFRELPGSPMSRAVWWLSTSPLQNPSLRFRGPFLGLLTWMARVQPGQPTFFEARFPSANVAPITAEGFRKRRIRLSVRQTKNQPGPPNVFGRQGSRPCAPFEFTSFMGSKN
jgi:hypothetical protein